MTGVISSMDPWIDTPPLHGLEFNHPWVLE